MSGTVTLILGGCRSGKSRHALALAEAVPGRRRIFIATCIAQDEEMRERVALHRAQRSGRWSTEEVPLQLAEAVARLGADADVLLIDCLTLWVSNLMLQECDPEALLRETERLCDSLKSAACPVFLVTNEVGTGIVPTNLLARQYRDAVGRVNQVIAACADRVLWMVAGIPVRIKEPPHP